MSQCSAPSANIVSNNGVDVIARTGLAVWMIFGLIKRGAKPSFFRQQSFLGRTPLYEGEILDAWEHYTDNQEHLDLYIRNDDRCLSQSVVRDCSRHLPGRRILWDVTKAIPPRFHSTKVCVCLVEYLRRHGVAHDDLMTEFPELASVDITRARDWAKENPSVMQQWVAADEFDEDENRRSAAILNRCRPGRPTRLSA